MTRIYDYNNNNSSNNWYCTAIIKITVTIGIM